jgi:hypothetical protein
LYEKKYILIIIGAITGLLIFSSSSSFFFNLSYYSGLIRTTTQSSLSLLPWDMTKNVIADDGISDDNHHLCPPGMHYDKSHNKCVKDQIFEEEDKNHGSGRCPNSSHISPSIGCQPVTDLPKGSAICPNSSNRSSATGCENI